MKNNAQTLFIYRLHRGTTKDTNGLSLASENSPIV